MKRSKESINWYRTVYQSIIIRAKSRGDKNTKLNGVYTEVHHIVPKCMGGKNEDSNLCVVTFKEHVILHKILCILHPEIGELFHAVYLLLNLKGREYFVTVRDAEFYRKRSIEYLREINLGKNNPAYGKKISEKHKQAISRANKGKKKSFLTRQRMSNAQKGKHASKETKELLSKIHTGMKTHTEEHKKELSNKWKLNNPRAGVDMTGENNPSSRKIFGPDGTVYKSIKYCASVIGVSYETMRKWVKEHKLQERVVVPVDGEIVEL